MLLERFRRWLASFRRVEGIELPDAGRSSVEGTFADRIGASLEAFSGVSPVFDLDILRLLNCFAVFNPDVSQYVSNIVNIGNTGHQITVDAPNSQRAEAALARINESASRLYRNGAGIDGLINQYFRQVAVFGAISSEDVVNFVARRVEQVVIVPVAQIRFRYLEGEYVPHQQPGTLAGLTRSPLGLIPLNPATYHYYALLRSENNPYAIPPGAAAVDAITGPQTDMISNVKYIAQKFGILGLITMACAPPPKKPSETDGEYNARAQKYLASIVKALEPNMKNGLLATFRDQRVEHASVTSDARGFQQLWQTNEEQVMSALKQPPAFFGRTDSTTETYAGVVYNLLTAQVGNIQRLIKRRQEATYRLDLRLAGLEVDGLSLGFDRAHALNPLQEAQAAQAQQQMIFERAEKGIISPDDAARELGYEAAFDPEVLSTEAGQSLQRATVGAGRAGMTATFRFDRAAQRYRFASSRIELAGAPVEAGTNNNVVALKKKAA